MHRQDMRLRRLSPRTLENYDFMLSPFIAFLQGEGVAYVGDITPRHIRAYLLTLQAREMSLATQATAARRIKTWLNFLVREGVLDVSPMRTVPMPRQKHKRPVIFTLEEVESLLDAAQRARDKAIILFLLDSGARVAELVALDIGDVSLTSGFIRVRDGKGGRDRASFLGVRTRRTLRAYLEKRGDLSPIAPLWTSITTGERLTPYGVRMLLRRLKERTDITHATPHTFRRTCATWCLKSGMDIYAVAGIMGHTDISTLKHYLNFLEDDLAAAHKKYGPVNGYLTEKEKEHV